MNKLARCFRLSVVPKRFIPTRFPTNNWAPSNKNAENEFYEKETEIVQTKGEKFYDEQIGSQKVELPRTLQFFFVGFDYAIAFFSQNYYMVVIAAFVFMLAFILEPFSFLRQKKENVRASREWREILAYQEDGSDDAFSKPKN